MKEIATLVEEQWEKHPKEDSKVFIYEILKKYNLTDLEWEEVLKECDRRTEMIKKKFWFYKYITDPLLTFLSYILMGYTSIFILMSLLNIYTLPSQILFPNGTYMEKEQLVNVVNLIIVGIGFVLMYVTADRKRNR